MRIRFFASAALIAAVAGTWLPARTSALGKPGLTPVPCPQQEWQPADPAFEALPGARAFFGRYDGGLYRVEIPANWNGELVLYAHGYVANSGTNGSNLRVGNHPIREHLISEGYAWAASSYRCNGYVPGQGLLDTMALTDLFTKFNDGRAPQRTYLTGTSMGGHVTVLGMHEFPTSFAGGLAMCPAGPELFDYFGAVSAAAEAITGVQFQRDTLRDDIAKMTAMLGTPPNYTDKGRQLASVEIQISGGPRPFAVEGLATRFIPNMTSSAGALAGGTTPGNLALTNSYFTYTIDEGLGLTGDALNGRVRRKAADPRMRSGSGPYEEIVPYDGKLERPLMTLHGTGDLFVPVFLEQTLRREVAEADRQSLLVQRVMRIAGHCGFSQPEMIQAFTDVVQWVRAGVRPQGDTVDGDLRNAGLTFTNPRRPGDPGGLTIAAASPTQAVQASSAKVDFVRDVQPIFRQHCYSCHGPTVHQNGLRLDRRADAMRGGMIAVIGRGDSAASRLYLQLAGQRQPQMPPTGALKPEQIEIIKNWIDQGAEWPDEASGETPPRPTPPLMRAALSGTVDEMRRLLDQGADVNARNEAGATALMWSVTDAAKVKLLLDRGADVNAKSDDGRTALFVAAGHHGSAAVVKTLLDHGATATLESMGATPVLDAAYVGDELVLRTLLAAGADPQPVGIAIGLALQAECVPCADLLTPKLDADAIKSAVPIMIPPVVDGTRLPFFFAHGVDPSITGPSGETLLMRAVSSDYTSPELVKTMLDRGAKADTRTEDGTTAIGRAARHGNAAIIDLLRRAGAGEPPAPAAAPPPSPAASPRAAVERSLPLLQQSDVTFMKKTGCVSCHNNTLTAMTVAVARSKGVRVDEQTADDQARAIGAYLEGWRERVLLNVGIPGDHDTVSYILLGLSAENYGATDATDAMVRFLRRFQAPDGHWYIVAHRPPIESSDIEVTTASMRAMQMYARKGDSASTLAVQAAARWLAKAQPRTTEDFAFRLLGLGWSKADKASVQRAAKALVAEQRADGGWAQTRYLNSDAYATGQALVALEQSGAMLPSDPVFQRGVKFLLNTQLADGSWFVRSRAIPIQPYFDSGFPHGRDQFISAAATNWATMALSLAIRPGT